MQLIDPVTGRPSRAQGVDGKLITSQLPDGSAITPDNGTLYDPPIVVSVWDVGTVTVNVVPYGQSGDATVSYTITKPGQKLPVLVKKVMATGTTAASLRGQLVYVAGTLVIGSLLTESGAKILTEGSTPLILEST